MDARDYSPLDVVLTRAEGAWVYDAAAQRPALPGAGRRYLVMLAAYSALNRGHCHPRLVRALVEQAGRLRLPMPWGARRSGATPSPS